MYKHLMIRSLESKYSEQCFAFSICNDTFPPAHSTGPMENVRESLDEKFAILAA